MMPAYEGLLRRSSVVKALVTRRGKGLLLFLLLGILGLFAVSVYTDASALGDKLKGFGWWAFAAALGLALCNYALRFLRWSLYLRGAELSLPKGLSLQVFLSGFALSVTPGKLGELIKSYLIREFRGVPLTKSAPLVVAERVTDLIALLVLGLVGVLLYGVAQSMVVAGLIVVGMGLAGLAWPWAARFVIHLASHPRATRRFREPLLEFYAGLAALVKPWPLLWATSLALIAWLAECVGFALIISAFPGAALGLGLAILIYAVTTVAGALSFLPGGLLVTEAAMTLLLVESSGGTIHKPTAVAATILTRLATLWFAVAIGLFALGYLRRRSTLTDKALAAASEAVE